MSFSQTDSTTDTSTLIKSDKGHWLTLRVGSITGGTDIGNRWIILGGYEGRFSKNWSIPIEAQLFQDTYYRRSWFMMSAALKLRFQLPRQSTNLYVQGGIGTYIYYPVLHYAAGVEYGLSDGLSLYLQVKKFGSTTEIRESFISIGININATSERLRREYETDKVR